jgi:prevent-host-death family protein
MELNITDIRENLADALNRVAYAGERIILKRRAKSVAALVSIEDLALLEQLEDAQDVKAARKAMKEKGRLPLAKVKERLGMK